MCFSTRGKVRQGLLECDVSVRILGGGVPEDFYKHCIRVRQGFSGVIREG